jgi:hypothetical protein
MDISEIKTKLLLKRDMLLEELQKVKGAITLLEEMEKEDEKDIFEDACRALEASNQDISPRTGKVKRTYRRKGAKK